jgi:hypothetical protein
VADSFFDRLIDAAIVLGIFAGKGALAFAMV